MLILLEIRTKETNRIDIRPKMTREINASTNDCIGHKAKK